MNLQTIDSKMLREQADSLARNINEFKNNLRKEGLEVIENGHLHYRTCNLFVGDVQLVAVVLEVFTEAETVPEKRRRRIALISSTRELVGLARDILKTFDPPEKETSERILEELEYLRGMIETRDS